MPTPPPSEEQRRLVSNAIFGRRHGVPTERPAEKPRNASRTRHRVEDIAEARRLARETDWLD